MERMRIGITGKNGFIGRHLVNYLELQEEIEIIPFQKSYFIENALLEKFVRDCDVIVHLAALNRHKDDAEIMNTNVDLVRKLIDACKKTDETPHIFFSSSIQETQENAYGKSKKAGRLLFEQWALEQNAKFSSLLIPNVFGPFGKPYYNSVVATFCHKLVLNEEPKIINDAKLKLIYINDLVKEICTLIKSGKRGNLKIESPYEITVSDLNEKLKRLKKEYLIKGNIPDLSNPLDMALFQTFRCFIPPDYFPRYFTQHSDDRGSFVEIVRANTSGQFSFSTTKPGITRGNHFHTRKVERFAVIKGKARIEIRKVDTNDTITYILDGEKPAYVDMPIWYTHNITNVGSEDLLTLFWINEPYDPDNPDTYFLKV